MISLPLAVWGIRFETSFFKAFGPIEPTWAQLSHLAASLRQGLGVQVHIEVIRLSTATVEYCYDETVRTFGASS